jgi:excisionase family DNA binding protein
LDDYRKRTYLSASEVSKVLGIGLDTVYASVRNGTLHSYRSASGQHRFNMSEIEKFRNLMAPEKTGASRTVSECRHFCHAVNGTVQEIIVGNAQRMDCVPDGSVNLVITSPPYFDTKMYSADGEYECDLGNIHDLGVWLVEMGKVWSEVYRVLQPGRKFFLNIMNLPLREKNGFRMLNLAGKTIDLCESIGFVFRRDIVWHKTNSSRAHFGTYPYPGGILINHAHEFILEFEKPSPGGYRKYAHVDRDSRERSVLEKDFWISVKKSDVWLMKPERSGTGRKHLSPFSLELPMRIVRAFSYYGETVLDPFLGSGTTLVATASLGRNGIGFELNRDYASAASERLMHAMSCRNI